MSNCKTPKSDRVTVEDRIVLGRTPVAGIQMIFEVNSQSMIVEGRISITPAASVDRDHDYLLREFIEASDE
jgi:hypothetical protein